MPRWQRLQLAACAGVIAYMLAYIGIDYGRLPHPTYFQLERAWRMRERVQGLASGYVGMWLLAATAGVLVGGTVWLALRWRRSPASDRALGLMLAWTATAAALAAGYYTWANWP
jgi:hypothetical protein